MKRFFFVLTLASLVVGFVNFDTAYGVPLEGVYAQMGTEGALNVQTVAPQGAVQVDYIPSLARFNGAGSMQVLQAAARFPAPILESGLSIRGLLGYQQQWAFYDAGIEDTYGGINVGISAELQMGSLPYVGEFLRPLSFYGYALGNRLVTAKANGQAFPTNGLILPAYGCGTRIQVPSKGYVYLGIETFTLPAELGTGQAAFSNSLKFFHQAVLGYRW